jgi:hypothetical protein
MSRQQAQTVKAGSWRVERRNAEGRAESVLVPQTVPVSEYGENVTVKTEDGRTVQVSRKLADIYPEKFTPVKGAAAQGAS